MFLQCDQMLLIVTCFQCINITVGQDGFDTELYYDYVIFDNDQGIKLIYLYYYFTNREGYK